jgi:glycosyltransferase involved in cell wall biosynthesis
MAEKTRELFQLASDVDRVIYNPVEVPDLVHHELRVSRAVMFAGTLTRKKGIISLVRAWPLVRTQVSDAQLHIWGKDGQTEQGGSMQEYLSTIISPEVKKSVTFHGHVALPDLLAAFQRAGIVVLPSYSEGFALTPLHAMAAGCPVIYTARGSGPELIDDGVTGMLIDPGRPEDIAGAIVRLLTDPAMAQSIGSRARETVRSRFSWNTLLAENEDFYRQCVKRFHARTHS